MERPVVATPYGIVVTPYGMPYGRYLSPVTAGGFMLRCLYQGMWQGMRGTHVQECALNTHMYAPTMQLTLPTNCICYRFSLAMWCCSSVMNTYMPESIHLFAGLSTCALLTMTVVSHHPVLTAVPCLHIVLASILYYLFYIRITIQAPCIGLQQYPAS
jgi:hypothetical protein